MICAYEQYHKRNWNTWTYKLHDEHPEFVETRYHYICGDYMTGKLRYVWVNAVDLMYPDKLTVAGFGNVINFFVNDNLGDRLLPSVYYKPADKLDEMYVIIECVNSERPERIADALEVIGQRKIGRKIRTRISESMPDLKYWIAVDIGSINMTKSFDQLSQLKQVELEGDIYTIADICGVNESNLSADYSGQAARVAYLGMKVAQAEAAWLEAKNYTQQLYAEIDLDLRQEFDDAQKKYTEAVIRNNVLLDDEYIEAEQAENKAYEQYKILRALVDALRDRTQMLISLGADLRQEYEATGMQILDAKEKLRRSKEDAKK